VNVGGGTIGLDQDSMEVHKLGGWPLRDGDEDEKESSVENYTKTGWGRVVSNTSGISRCVFC